MKKFRKPPSLRKVLTRQLIWMQTRVLTIFTLMAAVPILNVVSREQGLDAAVIEEIGRSVVKNATGTLALVPNNRLSRIVADYPVSGSMSSMPLAGRRLVRDRVAAGWKLT